MYKCINCNWSGEELSFLPLQDKCPVCGDEVTKLNKPNIPKPKEEVNFDINNDGVVDKKDAKLASKVMNKFKKKATRGKRK